MVMDKAAATGGNGDLSDLRAIKAETIQTRVHGQLRELLMIGRFRPGQALKIHDLAQVFGTSAQPVRESIRQLVTERALEALPNRSARVPLMTRERIEDLRRVRLAMEGLAAEMAAERVTPTDIAALRAMLDAANRADDKGDVEASVQHNMRFHFALYALSGSGTLLPFIESLWLQVGPGLRRSADSFDARDGRGTMMHSRMVEALERHDGPACRRAVEDDINRTFTLLTAAEA
jgi:DNA-binding GntR family transcriptional regulator